MHNIRKGSNREESTQKTSYGMGRSGKKECKRLQMEDRIGGSDHHTDMAGRIIIPKEEEEEDKGNVKVKLFQLPRRIVLMYNIKYEISFQNRLFLFYVFYFIFILALQTENPFKPQVFGSREILVYLSKYFICFRIQNIIVSSKTPFYILGINSKTTLYEWVFSNIV